MRSVLMAVAWCALPSLALVQQIVDGSDKSIGSDQLMMVWKGIEQISRDPYSAQVAKLRTSTKDPSDICGSVNLKNGAGGYNGFQSFIVYAGTLYLQDAEQCR